MKKLVTRSLGLYLNTLATVAPSKAAATGFQLFCRPYRIPLTEKQLAFFNSADRFQLVHDSTTVQGYRWGSGPKKILFLHGWQSHTYRWKTYIEALPNDEFSVFSLDAPGHGLSSGKFLSVPLYSSIIESFVRESGGIHSAVGHSLGGFSLLYSLYREPELPLDKVVLLAPPGEAGEFISVFKKTLGLTERATNLVIDFFAKQYNVTPDFFSAPKFAERVRAKGLIIHDEEDTEAPYQHVIPLHKAWKQSRLVTTRGYGHNLKSTSVVKEVVDFVNERETVDAPNLTA